MEDCSGKAVVGQVGNPSSRCLCMYFFLKNGNSTTVSNDTLLTPSTVPPWMLKRTEFLSLLQRNILYLTVPTIRAYNIERLCVHSFHISFFGWSFFISTKSRRLLIINVTAPKVRYEKGKVGNEYFFKLV